MRRTILGILVAPVVFLCASIVWLLWPLPDTQIDWTREYSTPVNLGACDQARAALETALPFDAARVGEMLSDDRLIETCDPAGSSNSFREWREGIIVEANRLGTTPEQRSDNSGIVAAWHELGRMYRLRHAANGWPVSPLEIYIAFRCHQVTIPNIRLTQYKERQRRARQNSQMELPAWEARIRECQIMLSWQAGLTANLALAGQVDEAGAAPEDIDPAVAEYLGYMSARASTLPDTLEIQRMLWTLEGQPQE